MNALVKVIITNPINFDKELRNYFSLRCYLGDFQRTPDGGFISKARLTKTTNNKWLLSKDGDLDLYNALSDWSINESDSQEFYKEHPEGIKWQLKFLCEI